MYSATFINAARALGMTSILASCFIMPFNAQPETISGRVQYLDSNPASGASRFEPIRFCQVEIWSRRPRPPFGIWDWGFHVNTITDGNGRFSVALPFETFGIEYEVYVTAENYAARVFPNTAVGTSRFNTHVGHPGGPIRKAVMLPTDVLDFTFDFIDAYAPQHWSMADAVRHGFDYVTARRDARETDILPKVTVQPGQPLTYYNHIAQTLSINNTFIFEDYTMLHEYAHFVEHQISSFAPIASNHDGCNAMFDTVNINSSEHAWMEGFANFFAMAVATSVPPGTLQGNAGGRGTFTIRQLEDTPWASCTNPPGQMSAMIENVVSGVLWDVADAIGECGVGSSEDHDSLSGFATQVIQIMDRELDLPRHPTIFDFIGAWNGRGLDSGALMDILVRHRIFPPQPIFLACPNNITVTAAPYQCGAYVLFTEPTLNLARRCATVQCFPPADGWNYEIGTTTVACNAFEDGVAIAGCSFTVTVNPGTQVPNPNGTGLLGIYYDNPDFTSPTLARYEAVNFDWGTIAPASGVYADTFSVRWSGQVVPRYNGTYTFSTISDDGVRLWVNGVLIIDNWTDHPAAENSGTTFLQAGLPYDIVMEMYENAGGATAKLMWSSSCQAKEIIPASHLLPARLECPNDDRPTYPRDVEPRSPRYILFGDALLDDGWLKLTLPSNAYGIAYVRNFSGARPVFGFEAAFKAALFGSTCCGNGAFPADGFSFNLVPAATVRQNPAYGEPAEEGLNEGLAINFDTWDNSGGEAPAIEVKWLGQVIARASFQPSQSPLGINNPIAAAREVLIHMRSDGRLSLSYGGVPIFHQVQTPYSPNVIGTPIWVLGARNGGANDNHWVRDLQITVNPPNITALYNTGVDSSGRPLADNVQDIHYQLGPNSPIIGLPLAATGSGGHPNSLWLPDNSSSAWITPTASTEAPGGAYYYYVTYFDLNGLAPGDAVIQGWLASDDGLVDIILNGVSTDGINGTTQFFFWRYFTISGTIQPGANTLTFVVYNNGQNSTGLRVQMCGWAGSTPQLKLAIDHARLETTIRWGSLPHKTYHVEHAHDAAGPWTRFPGSVTPVSYRAHYDHLHRFSVEPKLLYRVFEAP